MPPQATVNINANVSPAQAAIQKLINQQYNLNLNLSTKGGQPLGKITGQVSEFNKSLDAANARVVAFGASATVLYGLNKAFEALVTSTIEVQKSLADINVILNISDKQINQFGSSLFNVAKNTGQSFQEVAKAATEFSRQGLGVEETLKRTSEALILSRLSGLDTVKSVEALTAAVNSFASQSVTATQIVNKFATVDAAFAVSSADLAEAISRVGSSASQSGVQLDELIGLVTSAQQTTARGGAVIGNSFKTIFTRLQRGKVVDLLGSLGIETTNATGELRSTIDLLKDLGKVYDTLGSQQQASVAEAVGGVFQINILKAALADLGKEYSVYNNAVQISSTATNEAITRNDQLNKTLAAQINALKQNATQFAAKSGESLFGPALENLVGGGNSLLESLNNVDSESVGGKIGNGILKGIGDIIAGPGLALIGGVLLKLFGDFAKFSAGGVKELLGLNSAASQQQGIQSSISAILAKNPQIYQQMASGALSVNQASQVLLTVLQQQTAQMQQQSALTSQISKNLYGAGVRVPKGSQTAVTTKAAGYIPNFVDPYAMEEAQAKALGARSPRAQLSKGTIGGKKFIKNSEELEIPRFGKNGDSAVIPMYSSGYIPNFAGLSLMPAANGQFTVMGGNVGGVTMSADKILRSRYKSMLSSDAISILKASKGKRDMVSGNAPEVRSSFGDKQINKKLRTIPETDYAAIVGEFSGSADSSPMRFYNWKPSDKKYNKYPNANIEFSAHKLGVREENGGKGPLVGNEFREEITKNVVAARNNLTEGFERNLGFKANRKRFSEASIERNVGSISGYIFEDIVDSFLSDAAAKDRESLNANSRFDYPNSPSLRKLFPGLPSSAKAIESKANMSAANMRSVAEKIYDVNFMGYSEFETLESTARNRKAFNPKNFLEKGTTAFAAGYIPNFAERVGIVTGDVIRGNEYKEVLQYLANTTKPISTILGPAGVGKTTRASQMGGQLLKSFAEINKFDKFILDRAGFDVPQKDAVTAANIRKIFAKSNAAGSLDVLFGSRDTVSSLRDKRLKEGDKIIGERNNLKGGSGGVGSFTKGIRGFLGEYGNANVLRMRKSGEQYGLSKVNFASGYVPNFANALNESISREIGAGAPKSGIYTKQYSQLASSSNPLGIGVFNKRDEGTRQKEKSAMSRRGYATGYIPNFAEGDAGGSDIGKTLAAVGIQLTSFAGLMAFQIPQIKQSYQEEIATRKAALVKTIQEETTARRNSIAEEISSRRDAMSQLSAAQTQQRQQLQQEIAVLSAEGKKARTDANKKTKTIEAGGAEVLSSKSRRGAKLQATGGGLATVASFAPIIAETVASSIDTTTKEGRTKSAAVTGIGTVGSYAGTGALIGSMIAPGVGTAVGAGLGAIVGSAVAVNSVFKEMGTNLPELNAAIKKTSEEQSRLGEATGRVLPLLEQLQQLRASGNAGSKEAADLEKQIREIASSASPEVQKAISAGGLDFAKTNKLFADLNATMSKQLSRERGRLQGETIFEDFKKGKINTSDFSQAISKQAISGKTDAELNALNEKFSQATVTSSELTDALGIAAEDFNTLDTKGAVNQTTQALLDGIKREIQIRLEGAKGTAKSFAEKNAEAVQALQDFESSVRKAIASQDIATRASIASSGAAFASEFKRTKSTGQVGILQALGFDKAASDLETKNIYQDTIGAQKTTSAASVDQSIKEALNASFLQAIPSTTKKGVPQNAGQYNEKLMDLQNLTGDKDFSKKIQDISAKIGATSTKTIKGPLGALEQYDTEGIISQLEKNGVKDAEELNKVRETLNANNKSLFDAQKEAATKTVQRIDELIKVTIESMNALGGSIDDMLNDGGMGDGSAAEKFTEATDDFVATMKDPKATDEQRGQAANDFIKAQKKLGMEINTDDPAYKMAQEALTKIGQKQAESISNNLVRAGMDPDAYNQTVRNVTGNISVQEGLEEAAATKASIAYRPVDGNISTAKLEGMRQRQSEIIGQLGPEGAALAGGYNKATEAANKIPDGIQSLESAFQTQIGLSNSYLNSMVSIMRSQGPSTIAPQGGNLATISNTAIGMNSNAFMGGRQLFESRPDQLYRERFVFDPQAGQASVAREQNLPGSPLGSPYQGVLLTDEARAAQQKSEQARLQSLETSPEAQQQAALSFNSPITIAINAASQAQGEQIQAQLQGVDKDIIDSISNRLSKVESLQAAVVTRDPTLTPPPKKAFGSSWLDYVPDLGGLM
jgi:TP901 family phage tail tape measure protein